MNSVLNLPSLIYGTAWKKENTAALVEKAILCGFIGVDTACQPKHYNEAGVGQALQRLQEKGIKRESLYIQTKFTPLTGQDPTRVPYNASAAIAKQVSQSFQTSLKNLRVNYVDGLILHAPFPHQEQTMEAWRAMEELCQQKMVKHIGISNCYELRELKEIFDFATIKPSILQNRFYAETGYDKNIRQWCREQNIQYQGFWILTANPHILRNAILKDIAVGKGVTVEQLFLRFLTLEQLTPLVGTCSEGHMREDLAIFDFTLTDNEMSAINTLLSGRL